ncbi:MAG: hypothetical protein V3U52_03055 [Thermoplasmata archaeon]
MNVVLLQSHRNILAVVRLHTSTSAFIRREGILKQKVNIMD